VTVSGETLWYIIAAGENILDLTSEITSSLWRM